MDWQSRFVIGNELMIENADISGCCGKRGNFSVAERRASIGGSRKGGSREWREEAG